MVNKSTVRYSITVYKPKEYIIEGQKGGQYSPKSVQNIFKASLEKAGIRKKATVHSLRHSFVAKPSLQGYASIG